MYSSMQKIIDTVNETGLPFWQVVLENDAKETGESKEILFSKMKAMYLAMRESNAAYDPLLKSASGLVGGQASLLRERKETAGLLVGDFMGDVMEKALRTAENNACMKRIVAAPTAGSCGVMPSVLLTFQEHTPATDDDEMCRALIVGAGIGGVIGGRASLSGAKGGCQAEIGSASAMAAGALCYLLGGDAECIANAAALALKGLLGLACDPVAGLVEVPCVKRNVIGAINAVSAAEMAMAGIESVIPADQVFDAMRMIGNRMPVEFRETAKGGLAATPAGILIKEKISM